MAPRHLTVLRNRYVLEFLVFLQDNKKLSPRTFLGYRHSLSIPFKEAFKIYFADRDLSPKLSSISLCPLKENFPNSSSITLWKHSRPQDLGTAQPPWKTFSSKPSFSSQSPRAIVARSWLHAPERASPLTATLSSFLRKKAFASKPNLGQNASSSHLPFYGY